jgi:hypothetical protein
MRRSAFALISALFLLPASVTFAAVSMSNILVSGKSTLAIVDGNGDGPGYGDCTFMATTDSAGKFVIDTTQDMHTKLRACSGQYMGKFDPLSPADTSVFGTIQSSNIAGGTTDVPLSFDGMFLPQGGGGGSGGAAGAVSAPRRIGLVELTNSERLGSGTLCNSSAQVTLANGLPMLVALGNDTPGYVRVPNVPFEKLDFSGFVFLNVFVPKIDGAVTFALDPGPPLVEILLSGTCGRAAPTLSGMKLIVLAVGLLIGGVWVIGRRRAFYESLPLP